MKMLTLDKFEEASEKVKEVTLETKLVYSDYLSDQTGNKVYLKPENMQFTGAYKVRGAYYKISTLSEEERQRGLITASAGNHAQGVAYAAQDTVSSLRGHAGTYRDDRNDQPSAAGAVSGACHTKSDRKRGNLSAARSPAGPFFV